MWGLVVLVKMLALFLISAFFALAQGLSEIPADMKDMAQALHDNCVSESGVDEALIKPCETGNFANDPKLKCYFKCIFEQVGAISDDGLDAEAFASILPDSLGGLLKSIKACGDTKGSDSCDLASNFYECVYKKDPSSFLLI